MRLNGQLGGEMHATPVSSQLPEPNAAGIRTGHIHLIVPDMAEHLRIWKLLGGEESGPATCRCSLFKASTSC